MGGAESCPVAEYGLKIGKLCGRIGQGHARLAMRTPTNIVMNVVLTPFPRLFRSLSGRT